MKKDEDKNKENSSNIIKNEGFQKHKDKVAQDKCTSMIVLNNRQYTRSRFNHSRKSFTRNSFLRKKKKISKDKSTYNKTLSQIILDKQ